VSTQDVAVAACHSVDPDRWLAELDDLLGRIAGRFARVEPRRRARGVGAGREPQLSGRGIGRSAGGRLVAELSRISPTEVRVQTGGDIVTWHFKGTNRTRPTVSAARACQSFLHPTSAAAPAVRPFRVLQIACPPPRTRDFPHGHVSLPPHCPSLVEGLLEDLLENLRAAGVLFEP
jgi:hypothetical protein